MTERSRWLTLVMVILSAFALLAFAACGGDDDDDDTGSSTPTASSNGDGGDDDGGTPTDNGDDGGDDTGDPFANLDQFTEGLDNITGKITYRMTDEDGEVNTFTVYSDGAYSRYDTESDGTVGIFITTPDASITCDSGSETCFSYGEGVPGGGFNFFTAFLGSSAIGVYVAAAQAAGVDVDTSSEEHAGVDTECFSWTDDGEDAGTGKICFAEEQGVMLYEEFTSDTGTLTIEALDYSDDVSASDFEPPYDVTELPGG